jgi:hypothetical protein
MPGPVKVHDVVRLTKGVPTLWLQCGEVGVIRSVWFTNPSFYEVQFRPSGHSCAMCALLRAEQLEVIEAAPGRQE